MKKINKIRKMLGDRYHLSVESDGVEITKWVLFKNYTNGDPIYWSSDNKAIMRSEENTLEDLFKFAKTHQKLDLDKIILKANLWIITVALVMCFINFHFQSDILRAIIFTIDAMVILIDAIVHIVSGKNFKVDMRELNENWIRRMKEIHTKTNEEER